MPYKERDNGRWGVVVADGYDPYQVGHNLVVSRGEIETAIELTLGTAGQVQLSTTAEEAEAL